MMKEVNGHQGQLDISDVSSDIRYGENFLERLVGKKMLKNPMVALIELLANAWDAGATKVDIEWGDEQKPIFSIKDNGEGMTKDEFLYRWNTLSYNRLAEQGNEVAVFSDNSLPNRKVYGRNGIGRFAMFCFCDSFTVITTKNDVKSTFRIKRSTDGERPFEIEFITSVPEQGHGTSILVTNNRFSNLTEPFIISGIALRFMGDPNFRISVNGKMVCIDDVPEDRITTYTRETKQHKTLIVKIIDTEQSDRTTKLHGIAFQVNNRLVGEISWKHQGLQDFVDGRRLEGKRLLVLVTADFLLETEVINSDWTGFDCDSDIYKEIIMLVDEIIDSHLAMFSEDHRRKVFQEAKERSSAYLEFTPRSQVKKWETFIYEVQRQCKSIKDSDIVKLAELLAKLEMSSSRYSIISKLASQQPKDLDALHEVLQRWTIQSAITVLDEIQTRLKVLEELKVKTSESNTDEVHELQPLFERGLWIFGPEYETIHFTSNRRMNSVITTLFPNRYQVRGSANRPDFVIIPDGSIGCYSTPRFGSILENNAEIGIAKLVIVELKKPSLTLGQSEILQPKKYFDELIAKGIIDERTEIECYVLGASISQNVRDPMIWGKSKTIPITYDTVIQRAQSRLFHLDESIKNTVDTADLDNVNYNEVEYQSVIS